VPLRLWQEYQQRKEQVLAFFEGGIEAFGDADSEAEEVNRSSAIFARMRAEDHRPSVNFSNVQAAAASFMTLEVLPLCLYDLVLLMPGERLSLAALFELLAFSPASYSPALREYLFSVIELQWAGLLWATRRRGRKLSALLDESFCAQLQNLVGLTESNPAEFSDRLGVKLRLLSKLLLRGTKKASLSYLSSKSRGLRLLGSFEDSFEFAEVKEIFSFFLNKQ